MQIERVPVEGSSNVAAIGYDQFNHVLSVEFAGRGGKPPSVYEYSQVPEDVWLSLMHSPSKGSYLSANVKGRFPVQRVQ